MLTAGATVPGKHNFLDDVSLRTIKPACRVSTTAALAAYTRSGNTITADANGALGNIDGVNVEVGDRVLFRHGAAGADNGIWVIVSEGAAGAPFIFRRAADFDATPKIRAGAVVVVAEGTLFGDTVWALTANNTITINTTTVTFSFLGGASISSGSILLPGVFEFTVGFADLGSGASHAEAHAGFPLQVIYKGVAIDVTADWTGEADLAYQLGFTGGDTDALIASTTLNAAGTGWFDHTSGVQHAGTWLSDASTSGLASLFTATELDDVTTGALTGYIYYDTPIRM